MINKINFKAFKSIVIVLFILAFIFTACTSEVQPLPDECEGTITLQSSVISESTCNQQNGSFSIIASGGAGDFTYQLNGQSSQTLNTFSDLAAGAYTVIATDAAGCSAQINVNIQNEDGVNAALQSVTNSACDDQTGSISVTASDGQGPYEYKLNDGDFQANAIFQSLAPGTYVVSVKDATGCQVELVAEVRSTVLFTDIRDIIQTNCAISGCHNGSRFPDLRSDNNIAAQASRIMSRTGNRSMPPSGSGRSLSNEEIEAIACWVNDGAPIN